MFTLHAVALAEKVFGVAVAVVGVGGLVSKNDTLMNQTADRFEHAVMGTVHQLRNLADRQIGTIRYLGAEGTVPFAP